MLCMVCMRVKYGVHVCYVCMYVMCVSKYGMCVMFVMCVWLLCIYVCMCVCPCGMDVCIFVYNVRALCMLCFKVC